MGVSVLNNNLIGLIKHGVIKMKVSMILATDLCGGIGLHNSLPWRCKEDMLMFKQITLHKPVIMGRKTFESIGKPLSDRLNIVVTTQATVYSDKCQHDYVVYVESPFDALWEAQRWLESNGKDPYGEDEVMVIGGASVYEEFLPIVETVYLTTIYKDFECDVYIDRILQDIENQFDMYIYNAYFDEVNWCNVSFSKGDRINGSDIGDIINILR